MPQGATRGTDRVARYGGEAFVVAPAADRALYRAKHDGRNRVCHADGIVQA